MQASIGIHQVSPVAISLHQQGIWPSLQSERFSIADGSTNLTAF